jgi:hypothetical protein
MVEEETMPALEISDLMSLMEDLPGNPALNTPSLLESPSSPHSTTTEDISIFGGAEFEGSYMDLPPPEEGAPDAPLIVSLQEHSVKPARRASRKRSHDDNTSGTSAMTEDDVRKAQRMARNRRAAATSRARKKEHLESLQAQVDSLQAENAELRRRLKDAGLMSDELEEKLGRRPYGLQPAALSWTYSPQLEYPLPTPQLAFTLVLALLRLHLLASTWLTWTTVSISRRLALSQPNGDLPAYASSLALMWPRCTPQLSLAASSDRRQLCVSPC